MTETAQLLERFRRGGELLASLTTGAAGAELDFVPEGGALGIRSIVCGLMDGEMFEHGVFSALIAENSPAIPTFDAAAWAAGLNYRSRKFSGAVELFRRIRAENHDLLKDLEPEAWGRRGLHPKLGKITLAEVFVNHLEHTEGKILSIREIRALFKAFRQTGTTT
ncbi:MAG: DinB family protein [Acidobacteriota bacterium]